MGLGGIVKVFMPVPFAAQQSSHFWEKSSFPSLAYIFPCACNLVSTVDCRQNFLPAWRENAAFSRPSQRAPCPTELWCAPPSYK